MMAALKAEAAGLGRPAWRPMLVYAAGLHGSRQVVDTTGALRYHLDTMSGSLRKVKSRLVCAEAIGIVLLTRAWPVGSLAG